MNLQQRIELLAGLKDYILSDVPEWQEKKREAGQRNYWFTPDFIDAAVRHIVNNYLIKNALFGWADKNRIPEENSEPRSVGVIMAGNVPLVGFHDFLSVFITGNNIRIKASSKDAVLIQHLVDQLMHQDERCRDKIKFESMLKGCDAYIATGSNNSSRYFEYYFGKYPNIIRKNRTSVAILDGTESDQELSLLADDVHLYFGLGCRNVTKIFVPAGYDFIPLLDTFRKYNHLIYHHHYKNNFDYNLALHILNKKFYMTNESILLVENNSLYSPISQLNYEFYNDKEIIYENLKDSDEIQCLVGHDRIPFGQAQFPAIDDFADGINTVNFLNSLGNIHSVRNL